MYFFIFFKFFEFFEFFKTFVGHFLIGEHISIWMSPFRFESSCDRDGGMWWIILQRKGPYMVVGDAGNFFTTSHTAMRASSWPYMDFNFFVTSVPGVGLCTYMAYGRGLPIYGSALAPWVFGGTKMCVTLLLIHLTQNWQTEWSWKFIFV